MVGLKSVSLLILPFNMIPNGFSSNPVLYFDCYHLPADSSRLAVAACSLVVFDLIEVWLFMMASDDWFDINLLLLPLNLIQNGFSSNPIL